MEKGDGRNGPPRQGEMKCASPAGQVECPLSAWFHLARGQPQASGP